MLPGRQTEPRASDDYPHNDLSNASAIGRIEPAFDIDIDESCVQRGLAGAPSELFLRNGERAIKRRGHHQRGPERRDGVQDDGLRPTPGAKSADEQVGQIAEMHGDDSVARPPPDRAHVGRRRGTQRR